MAATATAPSPVGSNVQPYTSTTSVSPFASGYVSDILGTGQTLADKPFQSYLGGSYDASGVYQPATDTSRMVAGYGTDTRIGSALSGIANLTLPTELTNASFTSMYTDPTTGRQMTQAQRYMNPYLQASLEPQLAEARRQSGITQLQNQAQLAKAGAYGGGRQAIMQSEGQRNLEQNLANITGTGYNTAFDKAMQQYNQEIGDQLRISGEKRALAQEQLAAGREERALKQEDLTAKYNDWKEAQQHPYKQLEFQQSLLSGLPITQQQVTTPDKSLLEKLTAGVGSLGELANVLGSQGLLTGADGKRITSVAGAAKWIKDNLLGGGTQQMSYTDPTTKSVWSYVSSGAAGGDTDMAIETLTDGTYRVFDTAGNLVGGNTGETLEAGAATGWSFWTDPDTGDYYAYNPETGDFYDASTNTVQDFEQNAYGDLGDDAAFDYASGDTWAWD